MKRNRHTTQLIALAIAITVALLTRSASAQSRQEITVIENSPSSLSVSINGSTTGITVRNTSPDNWSVTIPFSVQSNFDHYNWTESATTFNVVTFSGSSFTVVSDSTEPPTEDGSFPDNSTFPVGAVGPDGVVGVDMGFKDNADSKEGPSVPDTGSTLGLLALALAALFGASRLRCIRDFGPVER
jgi:hypothetical protein